MTGVGVTPSSCWMMVSTPLAARTSSAVRCAGLGQRVRILAHVKRAVRALRSPVVADRLRDGENMRFGKGAVQRGTAMSAGSETDHLVRDRSGPAAARNIPVRAGPHPPAFLLVPVCRQAGKSFRRGSRRILLHRTWFHLPNLGRVFGYGAVAGEFPEPATFRMALRAHASGSAYNCAEPLDRARDRT